MTGAELLKARNNLGLSQANCAVTVGVNSAGGVFTATDISTAEGVPGTIANSGLNVACEKFLRPHLNKIEGLT